MVEKENQPGEKTWVQIQITMHKLSTGKGHTRENPLDYLADKKGRICDLSDFSEKYIKRLTFVWG